MAKAVLDKRFSPTIVACVYFDLVYRFLSVVNFFSSHLTCKGKANQDEGRPMLRNQLKWLRRCCGQTGKTQTKA